MATAKKPKVSPRKAGQANDGFPKKFYIHAAGCLKEKTQKKIGENCLIGCGYIDTSTSAGRMAYVKATTMEDKAPMERPANTASSNDPKYFKATNGTTGNMSEKPTKLTYDQAKVDLKRMGLEHTSISTSTWTVGNALSCTRCGQLTFKIFASTFVGKIDKDNIHCFARCLDCIPRSGWTPAKWVKVIRGCLADVAIVVALSWIVLVPSLALFTVLKAIE